MAIVGKGGRRAGIGIGSGLSEINVAINDGAVVAITCGIAGICIEWPVGDEISLDTGCS